MADRLTVREAALLAGESQHTPAHLVSIDVLEADPDFDLDAVVALLDDRLTYVPRYRQRVRSVLAPVSGPVWVDDEDFDLSFHVRRSALPSPGTDQQLREFVGRVAARRLDHDRPLWEAYLVEGLQTSHPARQRFALVIKTHVVLVDGLDNVELGQVLFDDVPDTEPLAGPRWQPAPEPSAQQLILDAITGVVVDPVAAVDDARRRLATLWEMTANLTSGGLLRVSRGNESAVTGWVSRQRRVATAELELASLRALRSSHQVTVNDVIVTVLAGALRLWLSGRGSERRRDLVAMVPMSVPDLDGAPSSLGSRVAPHLMILPLGEPDPLVRLQQVAHGTRAHTDAGRAVRARTLADIAGFAPGTLHALAGRAAGEVARHQHDVVISNSPGPQRPMFVAGAELVASYPVLPLSSGHLLAIGVTSYNGRVFVGFTGDRDQLGDLDQLAACVAESVAELHAMQEV